MVAERTAVLVGGQRMWRHLWNARRNIRLLPCLQPYVQIATIRTSRSYRRRAGKTNVWPYNVFTKSIMRWKVALAFRESAGTFFFRNNLFIRYWRSIQENVPARGHWVSRLLLRIFLARKVQHQSADIFITLPDLNIGIIGRYFLHFSNLKQSGRGYPRLHLWCLNIWSLRRRKRESRSALWLWDRRVHWSFLRRQWRP